MASSSSSSVVFLITGASRGLGRAIATVAGKHYASQTKSSNGVFTKARFLLVARSSEGMEDTKKELLASTQASSTSSTTSTTTIENDDVLCRSMDLSDLDRLDSNIDVLLNDLDKLCHRSRENITDDPEKQKQQQRNNHLIFVNNAASLGHLGPSWKSPSLEDMRQTIDLNVTGSFWLSVRFARYVQELQQQQQQQIHAATIVNISSLAAVSNDFPGMGMYSAGKAARDMYHSLMAKEEEDSTPLRKTLNYAPGPLETTMLQDIRDSRGLDENLRSKFDPKSLDPEDSARKLIRLLDTNDFQSGSHIDYYDLPE